MADDVQLTDLEVIQRYSLAIRRATASRAELVAALEADLAWLTGSPAGSHEAPAPVAKAAPAKAAKAAPAKGARRTAARKPAKSTPAPPAA